MHQAVQTRWQNGVPARIAELAPIIAPLHGPGSILAQPLPFPPMGPVVPGGPDSLEVLVAAMIILLWRSSGSGVVAIPDAPPIRLRVRWAGGIGGGGHFRVGGSGSREEGGGRQNPCRDVWRPPEMSPGPVDTKWRHLKVLIATHIFQNNIPNS